MSIIAVLAAVGLLLPACGGDGESSESSTVTESSTESGEDSGGDDQGGDDREGDEGGPVG